MRRDKFVSIQWYSGKETRSLGRNLNSAFWFHFPRWQKLRTSRKRYWKMILKTKKRLLDYNVMFILVHAIEAEQFHYKWKKNTWRKRNVDPVTNVKNTKDKTYEKSLVLSINCSDKENISEFLGTNIEERLSVEFNGYRTHRR